MFEPWEVSPDSWPQLLLGPCAIEAAANEIGEILLIEKTDNHSNTIRKFYKDNKRVDKDYKGQVTILQGNVDFFDGTKETTLDYFNDLLDNEKIDSVFIPLIVLIPLI